MILVSSLTTVDKMNSIVPSKFFVERFHDSSYFYHCRKYSFIKTIDECEIYVKVCFYQIEIAYLTERCTNTMSGEILHDH